MKETEYLKIDDRGRIVIPSHIRKIFGIEKHNRLVLSKDTDSFKLTPFSGNNSLAFNIFIRDTKGSWATVLNTIAKNNVNVLMSESKTLHEGKLAKGFVVVNGNKKNLESIQKEISCLESVKRIEPA